MECAQKNEKVVLSAAFFPNKSLNARARSQKQNAAERIGLLMSYMAGEQVRETLLGA